MSTSASIAAVAALILSIISIAMSVWTAKIQRDTRRMRENRP